MLSFISLFILIEKGSDNEHPPQKVNEQNQNLFLFLLYLNMSLKYI